jgi:prepilin-type processing-associated H-X9-DG protein/prepilin-type N-terminal cleavage/methylation domain-containing protein
MRRAFTLVELIVVVAILGLVVALLLPAIQKVRATVDVLTCTNNLRTLGAALQMHHTGRKYFPSGCTFKPGEDPFVHGTWCLRVLPYLEQEELWHQALAAFRSEPFFLVVPPHSIGQMKVSSLLCPANTEERTSSKQAKTHYLGVAGTNHLAMDGILFLNSRVRAGEIGDGLSNTLLLGERPPAANGAYGWWYAGWGQDLRGSAEAILGVAELNAYKEPRVMFLPPGPFHFQPWDGGIYTDILHFWSNHPGGANFLFADGSVRFVRYSAAQLLPALATRNGDEIVLRTAIE